MDQSVAVVVDNIAYKLKPDSTHSVLHTGMAPVAQDGYYYTKLNVQKNVNVRESFDRLPVHKNTPNEFFNRSWNIHDNYQLPEVYPPLDVIRRVSSKLHRDNEIPTIYIEGDQDKVNEMHHNYTQKIDVKVRVHYLSLSDTFMFEDAKVRISGRSSREVAKLSYRLKLKKKDDLYGYRSIKLRAMGRDPSYVREQLGYDVLRSAGLASPSTSYVRVIMNENELGLFGLVDHVQNPWLANIFANGDPKYANGVLYTDDFRKSKYKTMPLDLSYFPNVSQYADAGYTIAQKAAKEDGNAFLPLQNLTRSIDQVPGERWDSFLYVDSVLRSLALEVLLGNTDGYIAWSDNYHIYQVPETGKFMMLSVDLDLTMGGTMDKNGSSNNVWGGDYRRYPIFGARQLTNKMVAVPKLKQAFETTLQTLNRKLINPRYTFARIDSLVAMIREDVVWDKGCQRLGNASIPRPYSNVYESLSFDEAVNGTQLVQGKPSVRLWLEAIYHNTTLFFHSQEKLRALPS
ncbi:coth protein-domain-containing protein [Sporodiniella umbellata]|nr:coth protein-domain-containing protein [Sporodiniella umbellata]